MPTDKSMECYNDLLEIVGNGGWKLNHVIAIPIIKKYMKESTEAALKESAERAVKWMFMPYPDKIDETDAIQVGQYLEDGLRAAILNHSPENQP